MSKRMWLFLLLLPLFFFAPTSAFSSSAWIQLTPTGVAPRSDFHTSVYDPASNRLIIFGGCAVLPASCSSGSTNGVWVLANANGQGGTPTWTQLAPTGGPPAARTRHVAVYDSANNVMVIWGGDSRIVSDPDLTDVWVLTNANGLDKTTGLPATPNWRQLFPTGGPPAFREVSTAVYDPVTNRMIVFGGSTGAALLNDVWALTDANGLGGAPKWMELFPTGGPPDPRTAHSAVFDPAGNRMVIFGGFTAAGASSETWVLADASGIARGTGTPTTPAWTQLTPSGTLPSARTYHAAAYDSATNRMVIFGGSPGNVGYSNDVWLLDNANGAGGPPSAWSPISPTGAAPAPRFVSYHYQLYDGASNTMLVFGGETSGGYLNDSWVLTEAGGPPANRVPVITGLSLNKTSISENDSVTLSGSFTDPDVGDSHSVTISWGDGSPGTAFGLTPGVFSFMTTHRYLNNPPGTPSGPYTILVTVTDSAGATGAGSTTITVNNVAPVVGAPVVGPLPTACPFGARTVTAAFSDVGTRDTHSCTIAWGDGMPDTPGVISEAGGIGSCAASHVYPRPGSYSITTTVVDDDTGSGAATTRVEVGYKIDFLNLCLTQGHCTEIEAYQQIKAVDTWTLLNSQVVTLHPITIGIVDTGVNTTHQEFSTGVDFGTTPASMRVDRGDGKGLTHGTNVTGIIGANNISAGGSSGWRLPHMNGILSGIAGLQYTLEVRTSPTALWPVALLQLADSVNKVVAAGAKIVNVSWGDSPPFFVPQSACYRMAGFLRQVLATHSDTLFVVGAGNDNRDAACTIPANLGAVADNVLTVGGSNGDGRWTDKTCDTLLSSCGSNFGAAVQISAPAFVWAPGDHFPPQGPNEYSLFEGTSGSAPQAAAVAAILKSVRPALTPRQMKCVLVKTADPIHADQPIGPRLNALNAVRTVLDPAALGALGCPP